MAATQVCARQITRGEQANMGEASHYRRGRRPTPTYRQLHRYEGAGTFGQVPQVEAYHETHTYPAARHPNCVRICLLLLWRSVH